MSDDDNLPLDGMDDPELHEFMCETCGKTETLTNREALRTGWDYPPFLGEWGVLSPRTCNNCTIDTTAYWAVINAGPPFKINDLDERHQNTIKRIAMEPNGPLFKEESNGD